VFHLRLCHLAHHTISGKEQMCWSGEASATLAAIGLGTTAYAAYRKEPFQLWICLGYFSLMELLQAYTYTVINQCGNPYNQLATLLGYIHIAFQPFFINAMSLYFIPQAAAKRVAPFVYTLCFATAVLMWIHSYPISGIGMCVPGRPLCGSNLCSVSGNWHIAWDVPLNGWHEWWTIQLPLIPNVYVPYLVAGFLLPILYGSWRLTLYHAVMGPILAKFLTSNPNEWPAVWCLLSIAILVIVVKTPVRQILFVRQCWWEPLVRKWGERKH
jgi:hypothetical protein